MNRGPTTNAVVETIARECRIDRAAVGTVARYLGDALLIPRGRRGKPAVSIGPRDAARIVLGVMVAADSFGGGARNVVRLLLTIEESDPLMFGTLACEIGGDPEPGWVYAITFCDDRLWLWAAGNILFPAPERGLDRTYSISRSVITALRGLFDSTPTPPSD